MSSRSEQSTVDQTRTYDRAGSVVFLKTHEAFGGLSNMAGGFPLVVQGVHIHTSEALYQACRFPHLPEVQRLIIGQASPMTAKMKSKPHRKESRADWDRVRVKVMRWCLRVKLVQNWEKFSQLLLRTGDRPIVEESRKDDFWGAKPVDEQTLVGMNVLGRLLMELREAVRSQGREAFQLVRPPAIPDFRLFGRQIDAIGVREPVRQSPPLPTTSPAADEAVQKQASLFKAPVAREVSLTAYSADELTHREPLRNLTPYPTVKDSGVPWLGDVPTHWERRRLKSLLRVIDRRSSTGTETLLSLRRDHGIVVYAEHFSRPAQGATTVGYKIVTKGQLVVNRLQANNGLVFDSSLDGLVSPDYSVFEPRRSAQIVMPYLSLLLRTPTYRNHFRRESTGLGTGSAGFLRLYDDRFLETPVVIPPADEQASILRFLDHADRRMRRYIRAKQKLIKLLDEQKHAIVHDAIIRGLNPSVRLKPSGAEWLGEIPEHWEIRRAKAICSAIVDCKNRTPEAVEGGRYLVVRTTCVRAGLFSASGGYTTDEFNYRVWTARGAPRKGDVFFTREAPAGEACLVPDRDDLCMGQRMMYFRPDPDLLDPVFLLLTIYGPLTKTYVELATNGSTVGHLRLGQVYALPILWCPLTEQRAIVQYIGTATAGIDQAHAKAAREIALLREYRIRLIADVVTGKVDVREAATRLPEDVEGTDEGDAVDNEADIEESSDEVEPVAPEAEA